MVDLSTKYLGIGDIDAGLIMFAKRKFDLLPSKINNNHDIKHLFKQSNKVGR